ncbi:hypothetical protein P5673_018882 [Acropora cervicornis]|uniref:Uncharacterized protein n=1 Tax=Acropora cervicornis TaxID=6130 RepID=A0AAD9V2B0_ACRCE|nr:hypothetical protein P5673_018882 [Acropora cervicornis]
MLSCHFNHVALSGQEPQQDAVLGPIVHIPQTIGGQDKKFIMKLQVVLSNNWPCSKHEAVPLPLNLMLFGQQSEELRAKNHPGLRFPKLLYSHLKVTNEIWLKQPNSCIYPKMKDINAQAPVAPTKNDSSRTLTGMASVEMSSSNCVKAKLSDSAIGIRLLNGFSIKFFTRYIGPV